MKDQNTTNPQEKVIDELQAELILDESQGQEGEKFMKVSMKDLQELDKRVKALVDDNNQKTEDILVAIDLVVKIKGLFVNSKGEFDASSLTSIIGSMMIPGGADKLAKKFDLHRLAPLLERYSHLVDANKALESKNS